MTLLEEAGVTLDEALRKLDAGDYPAARELFIQAGKLFEADTAAVAEQLTDLFRRIEELEWHNRAMQQVRRHR